MMMGPAPADTSANMRRVLLFLVVVAVHAIVIYGFASGLTNIIKAKILGPSDTVEIAAPEEDEEEPPPPPPRVETPPPFIPPPEIAIEMPVAVTDSSAIQVVTRERPVEAPPPVVQRASVEVAPKINPRRPPPPSEEFYPEPSKRREEEGSVIVLMDVNEEGRVTDAKLVESSKYPLLDEAAIKYVKVWRLMPGTRDGKPVPMKWQVRVTFKLKK